MWPRKIILASDHGGFRLKEFLKDKLMSTYGKEIEVVDQGPSDEKSVDYPDFAQKACKEILKDWSQGKESTAGVLMCGSGQGIAMSANRFKGIRAALCWDNTSARLSRWHNNANALCLGGRLIPFEVAWEILQVWMNTTYEGGRHQHRLDKMDGGTP